MNEHITLAEEWTERGGPKPAEYEEFNTWLENIALEIDDGRFTLADIKNLQGAFGEALSKATLQGISLIKPRGYAGDFEVIDRVYQRSMTTNPQLLNWDHYLLNTKAARAVRNRKSYFLGMLDRLSERKEGNSPISVLNVASGPARDVFEFLGQDGNDTRMLFDCIEYDPVAIRYAMALCYEYLDRIQFFHKNAFRFTTEKRYPLIWSAGLFDYFDDRRFKFLLKRLYGFLEPEGELVIGNFSKANPDQPYMEVMMEWELHHRNAKELTELAAACGIQREQIDIGQEPEGVNLFLHVKNLGE